MKPNMSVYMIRPDDKTSEKSLTDPFMLNYDLIDETNLRLFLFVFGTSI